MIIVAPLKAVASDFDWSFKKDSESKTSALVEAVTSLNIPVIVSALAAGTKINDLIEGVHFESVGCQIIWRKSVSPWDGGHLLSLLNDSDNLVLIVCGTGQTPSRRQPFLAATAAIGVSDHFGLQTATPRFRPHGTGRRARCRSPSVAAYPAVPGAA